jgi:hypothetical protein
MPQAQAQSQYSSLERSKQSLPPCINNQCSYVFSKQILATADVTVTRYVTADVSAAAVLAEAEKGAYHLVSLLKI